MSAAIPRGRTGIKRPIAAPINIPTHPSTENFAMRRCIPIAIFLGLIVFLISLKPTDADGCAAVHRSDRPSEFVRIAEESAVIIWDPVKMRASNAPEADQYIRREYSKGWEL